MADKIPDNGDDGMLSRWSKRKRGLVKEEVEPILSSEAQAEIDEEREAILLANREAAEEIDLDTIDEESDLSIFMKEGVPEALKRKALSVLWRSNPVFANVDGLCDYDQDFGDKSLNMKVFKSAWQAGRGYLKQVVEEAETAEELIVVKASDELGPSLEDELLEEEQQASGHVDEGASEAEEPLEVTEADYEIAEDVDEEPEPTPKVSLRQRLALSS